MLTLVGGGLLAYYFAWFAERAAAEWWEDSGFWSTPTWQWVEAGASLPLRLHRRAAGLPGALVRVAGAAASAITSEYEEDTWVSLTTTDLTGREIILAKLLGALRRGGPLAAVVIALASAGAGGDRTMRSPSPH